MKILTILMVSASVYFFSICSCIDTKPTHIDSYYNRIEGEDIELRNKLRHKGRHEGKKERNKLRHQNRKEGQKRKKALKDRSSK